MSPCCAWHDADQAPVFYPFVVEFDLPSRTEAWGTFRLETAQEWMRWLRVYEPTLVYFPSLDPHPVSSGGRALLES